MEDEAGHVHIYITFCVSLFIFITPAIPSPTSINHKTCLTRFYIFWSKKSMVKERFYW